MSARRWFGAPPTQRWATAPMAAPKSSTTTTTASAVTTSRAPTKRRGRSCSYQLRPPVLLPLLSTPTLPHRFPWLSATSSKCTVGFLTFLRTLGLNKSSFVKSAGRERCRATGTKATAAQPEQRLRLPVPFPVSTDLFTGLDADDYVSACL
ncbi:hypothetical protein L209DRAFT_504367 [Thermothelomyces heterothallicus CBS 203.75]